MITIVLIVTISIMVDNVNDEDRPNGIDSADGNDNNDNYDKTITK